MDRGLTFHWSGTKDETVRYFYNLALFFVGDYNDNFTSGGYKELYKFVAGVCRFVS